jgi:hypothetical protein
MLGASLVSMSSAATFVAREHPNLFGDAAWYAQATPALAGNRPLYPPQWLGPHVAASPTGFNLPPATALLGPIASLSIPLWGALMAACILGGLAVLWPRLPDPWDFFFVCALVSFWPLWSALIWSNANALVFLLLAIGYRWPRRSGWTIGASAAIKASPVLLFAVLIGRRDWRQLAFAVATGGALTLAVVALTGWDTLVDFVRVQVHESHPALDYGWSAREFLPETAVVLLALTLAGIAVARRGSWAWALSGTLVLIPTLWLHYWIWALVPVLGWVRSRYAVTAPGPAAQRSAGVIVPTAAETPFATSPISYQPTRSTVEASTFELAKLLTSCGLACRASHQVTLSAELRGSAPDGRDRMCGLCLGEVGKPESVLDGTQETGLVPSPVVGARLDVRTDPYAADAPVARRRVALLVPGHVDHRSAVPRR